MSLELTLALIKPHVLKVPCAVEAIRKLILENDFFVIRARRMKLSTADVKQFYGEHSKRFFYNRLITFMQSGPVDAYILARSGAIEEWRKLMGPTKVYYAQYHAPDSLRGRYGLTDTRNAFHGSDSSVSALREVSIVFPDFDSVHWMKTEKPCFEEGSVEFKEGCFVHVCLPTKTQKCY